MENIRKQIYWIDHQRNTINYERSFLYKGENLLPDDVVSINLKSISYIRIYPCYNEVNGSFRMDIGCFRIYSNDISKKDWRYLTSNKEIL